MTDIVRLLAQIMLGLSALGGLVFVVSYAVMSNWRRSPLGRNVMGLMAIIAVMLTLAVIRNFLTIPHIEYVRLVSYTTVAVLIWQRVVLLFQAQREGRHLLAWQDRIETDSAPDPRQEDQHDRT